MNIPFNEGQKAYFVHFCGEEKEVIIKLVKKQYIYFENYKAELFDNKKYTDNFGFPVHKKRTRGLDGQIGRLYPSKHFYIKQKKLNSLYYKIRVYFLSPSYVDFNKKQLQEIQEIINEYNTI